MKGKHSLMGIPSKVQSQAARPGLVASSTDITAAGLDPWVQGLRLWYLLLQDVTSKSFMEQVLRARFIAFCDLPMLDVLTSLDKICDAHLAVISSKSQPSFIRDVLGLVPDQCRGFIHTLEGAIGQVSSRGLNSVRSWRQVLTFLLRPTFGRKLDSESFILEWEARNLAAETYSDSNLGTYMFNVTDVAFEERVMTHAFGCHGPGSTAFLESGKIATQRLTVNRKDQYVRRIPTIDIGLPDMIPYATNSLRVNVLKDVPKTWKKNRLIAIEPCNQQFHQQAIKNGMYYAISVDSFWSRHIDFEHAEKAYPLVRTGSKNGSYATVDLTAASDSVSVGHMLELLRHYPGLSSWMMEARSCETLLPNGETVTAHLAATMGNAFCFPLESLVFGCVCLEAIDKCGGDIDYSRFRVYGDDIIIEERYFDALIDLLKEYGFCPNLEKTFNGASRFRESCGLECFEGQDVTPLRLPRSFKSLGRESSLDAISAWVSLANDCIDRFPSVRKEICHALITEYRFAIPFSEDGSLGLQSVGEPNNSHLIGGYCPDLQREIVLYPSLTRKSQRRIHDDLAFYEWLGRAQERELQLSACLETSRVAARGVRQTIDWF